MGLSCFVQYHSVDQRTARVWSLFRLQLAPSYASQINSTLNLHPGHSSFLEFSRHCSECHPLNSLMLANILNDPLVHQQNMRLPAHLWVNRHWEDERIILPIREIELLHPQLLDDMSIHEALRSRSARDGLQGWPVVEVPVCWNLNDFGRPHNCHGRHPGVGGFGVVGFNPSLAVIGGPVGLDIVCSDVAVSICRQGERDRYSLTSSQHRSPGIRLEEQNIWRPALTGA